MLWTIEPFLQPLHCFVLFPFKLGIWGCRGQELKTFQQVFNCCPSLGEVETGASLGLAGQPV